MPDGILAGAFAGAVAGTISSLVAPWVTWRIENQREMRAHRRQLLAQWRQLVASQQEADRRDILRNPDFLSLDPHLSNEARELFYGQTLHVVVDQYGTVGNLYLAMVRKEANRLEREWGLS